MGFYFHFLLFCAVFSQAQTLNDGKGSNFRMMFFNVWNSGRNVEKGIQKIGKHIKLVNPDIVALTEIALNDVELVKNMLGPEWKSIGPPRVGSATLTRHNIVSNSLIYATYGSGCKIMLQSGKIVNVWNTHLSDENYGPYLANNKNIKDIKQVLAGELEYRIPALKEVLELPGFQKWLSESNEVPIIFSGDFNSPSHLDWIEENKQQHGNWVVEWPTTKLMESHGFIDSYRQIHPNVLQNPGLSWPIYQSGSTPEPRDRLDFIFYKGPLLAVQSTMYFGNENLLPMPNHAKNDYPSDHGAFFTDFQLV